MAASGSTPAGARTLDTLIKSQVLYQLSYKRIDFLFAGAKVLLILELAKYFYDFLSIMFEFLVSHAVFPSVRIRIFGRTGRNVYRHSR